MRFWLLLRSYLPVSDDRYKACQFERICYMAVSGQVSPAHASGRKPGLRNTDRIFLRSILDGLVSGLRA